MLITRKKKDATASLDVKLFRIRLTARQKFLFPEDSQTQCPLEPYLSASADPSFFFLSCFLSLRSLRNYGNRAPVSVLSVTTLGPVKFYLPCLDLITDLLFARAVRKCICDRSVIKFYCPFL